MNVVFDYPDEKLRPPVEISIDLDRVSDFLREQGVKEKDIKRLCIRFAHRYTGHQEKDPESIGGVCNYQNGMISIFTFSPWLLSDQTLNSTLLHELRHYIKKGYASRKEWELPHDERPSEIDANQFAEAWNQTHCFVKVIHPSQKSLVLIISVLVVAVSLCAAIVVVLCLLSDNLPWIAGMVALSALIVMVIICYWLWEG